MQLSFSFKNLDKKLLISGIDEAGRGPLAGPVVAACVVLERGSKIKGINDSKQLTKIERRRIFLELQQQAKFGIGIVDEKTIDRINILQATKQAMLNAYLDLQQKYNLFCEVVLVDGNFVPFKARDKISQIIPIIKGDEKNRLIAAASVIAKETRDDIMQGIHEKYPHFGFDTNVGYGTKFHLDAIKKFGICEFHRRSFEPIKSICYAGN